jgi:hypothetical protein
VTAADNGLASDHGRWIFPMAGGEVTQVQIDYSFGLSIETCPGRWYHRRDAQASLSTRTTSKVLPLSFDAWCRRRYSQTATPLCLEHVPLRLCENEYVPSLHLAVAPAGAEEAAIGRWMQFPWLLTYEASPQPTAGVAFATGGTVVAGGCGGCGGCGAFDALSIASKYAS